MVDNPKNKLQKILEFLALKQSTAIIMAMGFLLGDVCIGLWGGKDGVQSPLVLLFGNGV